MSNKEKPLPEPSSRAFRNRAQEEHSLLSDRMAAAIAEGRLEEFLKEELPDDEKALSLAIMMLGMTGLIAPGTGIPSPATQENEEKPFPEAGEAENDIFQTVTGGDVKEVVDLLRREHQKRAGVAEKVQPEKPSAARPADQPVIEKHIIDEFLKIATDNNVNPDGLILRAIKVYVEEFRKTGKL